MTENGSLDVIFCAVERKLERDLKLCFAIQVEKLTGEGVLYGVLVSSWLSACTLQFQLFFRVDRMM